MKNSKLISLLSTFNNTEWRKFGDFLASPFFNKRTDVILLYKYLKGLAPSFKEDLLTKEIILQKAFVKQKITERDLVYLFSYLLKLGERFLIEIQLEKNKYWETAHLLEELLERKLEKNYRRHIEKAETILQNQNDIGENYYFFQYQLSNTIKRHFLASNDRRKDASLQNAWNNLDTFYFFNKLKAACEFQGWKNIITEGVKMPFVNEVVSYLKQNKGYLDVIIEVYLAIYILLAEEPSKKRFSDFRNLLKLHQAEIPKSEKQNLYFYGINYCGFQINKNNSALFYAEQCLELYMEFVHQEVIIKDGRLSPWNFKNIVRLGLNLKKFEWTENFINEYHTLLEEEFQADALHFNLADLNYRKNNYEEAQMHLLQVQYSDIYYNLGAKMMLIKIYYVMGEEEALLSILASFTMFLKRNKKITNNVRQTYLNFTAFLNRILRLKPSKKEDLIKDIKNAELLTSRSWLLSLLATKKK